MSTVVGSGFFRNEKEHGDMLYIVTRQMEVRSV